VIDTSRYHLVRHPGHPGSLLIWTGFHPRLAQPPSGKSGAIHPVLGGHEMVPQVNARLNR
jgi:hypothetical protein